MATQTMIIRSVYPAHATVGVPVNAVVQVAFREAMNASTLSPETILLYQGLTPIPCDYSYDFMEQVLSITPKVPLLGESVYNLLIKAGVEGPQTILGSTSSQEWQYSFTTAVAPSPAPEGTPEVPENPVGEVVLEESTFSLIRNYPEDGNIVPVESPLLFVFSSAIAQDSIAAGIRLREKGEHALFSFLSSGTDIPIAVDATNTKDEYLVVRPAESLTPGTSYELQLTTDLQDSFGSKLAEAKVITFIAKWAHFYSSIAAVRVVLGAFNDSFSDKEIGELISQQSMSIYQQVSLIETIDVTSWSESTVPFAAKQYVLYATAYTIMLSKSIEASSGTSKNIHLGDLSIANSDSTATALPDLLGLYQKEMDRWWKLLTGEDANTPDGTYVPKLSKTLGSPTKAETNYPYPGFVSRTNFSQLGGS